MIKLKYIFGIVVSLSLTFGGQPAGPATAQAPAGSGLRLVSSDSQGGVLELTVDGFEVDAVEHEGSIYQRLIIPDMVQTDVPGQPQIPTRGTLLGLPSAEEVSLEILEADYETLNGYRLYPAPRLEVAGANVDEFTPDGVQWAFTLDQETYATNAFYPGTPVEIGYIGHMRDQAVAQIQFYPIQYNPTSGEVRFYRRILARFTSDLPLAATTAENRGASPAYEDLLGSALLNYHTLTRPPVIKDPPPSGGGVFVTDSDPALKIGVTQDGLYQLTPSDVTGAGFDLSGVALSTIKIRNRGVEIPIYLHNPNSNNTFDDGDYILFYGTAMDDMYTTKNVYWFEAGGANGLRMGTRDGAPSGGTNPTHFPVTRHIEEDSYYWQRLPNGEGQDHWFWEGRLSAPESRDYSFALNNISTTASTMVVRVRLRGYTIPEHRSRVYLNGVEIDDQTWSGQIGYTHEVAVPHSHLNEGGNTIRVEAVGSALNQFFVNWIEIDYWDTYVAENNQLLFGAPNGGVFQFEVTNFQDSQIEVFDVTDPANVTRIINPSIIANGGDYEIQFQDTATAETRYLALTAAQRKSPASIELERPSSWRSATNGADYIIITHQDFYTRTQTLADHRSASGMRVARVMIDDLYDEFNDGIFNPPAIRDFLEYAYDNWVAPAPSYVLLVGDAYYDYKDNLGQGIENYVPSQLVETPSLGQTASDNWFVLLEGDDILPDMFIGRLTPRYRSHATRMLNKIISYDQNPPDQSWNTNVLLVADDDSDDFETTSEQLADRLPYYYAVNRVYARDYPPGDPRDDITDIINSGSILVNYAGHGSVYTWGTWGSNYANIFTGSNVDQLTNTNKLPVVTIADCLNGYFVDQNASMAEKFLLQEDRGALGVWASTGLGYPSAHRAMMGAFYDAIFQGDIYGLGEATTLAKIAAYNQNPFSWAELVQTFVLFGDPAQDLGIPPNYPYLESTTPVRGAGDVALDQDIQIVFSKPMDSGTVQLNGLITNSANWSADNATVTYGHSGLSEGTTLTLTVEGQDPVGNQIGPGPVPNPWSFTTIYLRPRDVTTIGPTKGITETAYSFTANVSPDTVVQPITYEWQATDQAPVTHTGGGLSDTISFTWDITGTQTVTVTVSNTYGTAHADHAINISNTASNAVFLPIVIKND